MRTKDAQNQIKLTKKNQKEGGKTKWKTLT
jgi:hypothetical protein